MVLLWTSPSTAKAFPSHVTRLSSVPGVTSSGDCSGNLFIDTVSLDNYQVLVQYGAGRGKQGLFCGAGSGRGHPQADARLSISG